MDGGFEGGREIHHLPRSVPMNYMNRQESELSSGYLTWVTGTQACGPSLLLFTTTLAGS